jgi:LSU ribosomal protein L5P
VNGENGATTALRVLEEKVMVPRLKEKYQTEVVPALMQEFRYRSVMQVPRIEKIVLNIGLGEAIQNSKALDAATADLAAIAGQKPVITRARKSIAAFKVRQGMPIGVMVTLRGPRMWSFLDRLMNLVLPRLRDFRGVSRRSFDGRGNYSIGLREQIVFPEIDYDKVDKLRGLEVVIVTTAPDDEQGYALLKRLGMPFRD